MPAQCSAGLFGFAPVEGGTVVADFDGSAMTLDAGALLLRATDRVVGLTCRLVACFKDSRDPPTSRTRWRSCLQRVAGIALGYEDLNDHDQLRHDPVMTVLACKLEAHRGSLAPLAGKKHAEPSGTQPCRTHPLCQDRCGYRRH